MVENSDKQAGGSLPSELVTEHTHNLQASDNHQLPTEFPYDFASFTCPPDRPLEDDFFSGLTRQFALSTLLDSNKLQYAAASQAQKEWRLSSSPQSIQSPVFSNGSPTGPFQGPSSPTGPFASADYSWDLIREAAGQVNMLTKLKNQQPLRTNRALLCSPNNLTQHHSSNPHPCLFNDNHLKRNCESIWAGQQACQKGPQYGGGYGPNARCGNPQGPFDANSFVGENSLLFSGGRNNIPGNGFGGVKRKCAGTGVFLPRRGPDPVNSRVKAGCTKGIAQNHGESDARFLDGVSADVMAIRRRAALAQQWRNEVKMMAAMNYDTHLPNAWSY